MPFGQKPKTSNRSNVVTNSVKTQISRYLHGCGCAFRQPHGIGGWDGRERRQNGAESHWVLNPAGGRDRSWGHTAGLKLVSAGDGKGDGSCTGSVGPGVGSGSFWKPPRDLV